MRGGLPFPLLVTRAFPVTPAITLSTWPPTPPSRPQPGVTRAQVRPRSPSMLLPPRIVGGWRGADVWGEGGRPPGSLGPQAQRGAGGSWQQLELKGRSSLPLRTWGPVCGRHGAFLPEAEQAPGSAWLRWALMAEVGPGLRAPDGVRAVVSGRLCACPRGRPLLLPSRGGCPPCPVYVCDSARSCPTLCDPVDCSPPGSSVCGVSQARIQERAAVSSSRASSRPRD